MCASIGSLRKISSLSLLLFLRQNIYILELKMILVSTFSGAEIIDINISCRFFLFSYPIFTLNSCLSMTL